MYPYSALPGSQLSAVLSETGDAAGDATTTAVMSVGDSFLGSLQTRGDTDWVAITFEAGKAYRIDLKGWGASGLSDPVLTLLDSSGQTVTANDDGGRGLNSRLVFLPQTSGTYYIEAAGYRPRQTGDYKIKVVEVAPPDPLAAITWHGAQLNDSAPINVYFALAGTTVDDEGTTITSDGFSATDMASVMAILQGVSNFADISFQQTTDQAKADLQLATTNIGGGTLGYMYPQGTSATSDGLGVFTSDPTYWNAPSMQKGGFMYSVLVHELGHGMGLAHTHDNGGRSDVMLGVSGPNDTGGFGYGGMNQTIFSIMSYNDSWNSHPAGMPADYGSGYMAGYGALDIAVLQSYYGANTTFANGDDVYRLGADAFYQTIWDTGGHDRIEVADGSAAVIDLRAATLKYEVGGAGFVSYTTATIGGLTIANGVVIEDATGAGGADLIVGNSVGNRLDGRGGDDRLRGLDGNDRLLGGTGNDKLVGGLGNDRLHGGDGNDVLRGGRGADRFVFDLADGHDTLKGFSERDVIDLSGLGLTYADVSITSGTTSVDIAFGSTTLTVLSPHADFTADDFLF